MRSKTKTFFIKIAYIIIDIVCIYLAIYLACYIRNKIIPFDATLGGILTDQNNPFRVIFASWMLITFLFVNSNALYQTNREILEGFEIGLVVRSVFLSTLIIIVGFYALKIPDFPRTILFMGAGFMMLFLSVWRIFKRMFVNYIVSRHGYNNMNAVIVGGGRVGLALADEIQKIPTLGLKVVGFLDDFKTSSDIGREYEVLGKINDFKRIAKREFIDKVFITVHNDNEVFLRLLEEAKELGIAVRVVPQGFELVSANFMKYNIGLIPILEYSDAIPLRKQVGKRIFDFTTSLIGLIAILPFLLVIAILIKIDSPGPVMYFSRRFGRNGRPFRMYKFRSMHINADKQLKSMAHQNEVDGPIFKMKNDPRVTRVGKFLRKYSLDELPQVINVFLGQMSFVGPRPLPIDQVEREDLKQIKRLEVRPGITGLWQIRGRSDVSFKRLVRWDTWYINNWSFWLDMNILFATVPVVCKGKGAY